MDTIRSLGVRIIADHLGGMKAPSLLPHTTDPLQQPGFKALLSLAAEKHVTVKISGFYRASEDHGGGSADLEGIVRKFAAEVPGRLIWASDWPHTGNSRDRKRMQKGAEVTETFVEIDDRAIVGIIRRWVGEEVWWVMMVENPGKMFT